MYNIQLWKAIRPFSSNKSCHNNHGILDIILEENGGVVKNNTSSEISEIINDFYINGRLQELLIHFI